MDTSSQFEWVPATAQDMPRIDLIADAAHPTLSERTEVFQEKMRLFPIGTRKLIRKGEMVGYGLAHPWRFKRIPPLDTFLDAIPADADCLYIHDVVVAPEARGMGALGGYVQFVKELARSLGLPALAAVSVYGTYVLWGRYGFTVISEPALDRKLSSYGDTARYISCPVN